MRTSTLFLFVGIALCGLVGGASASLSGCGCTCACSGFACSFTSNALLSKKCHDASLQAKYHVHEGDSCAGLATMANKMQSMVTLSACSGTVTFSATGARQLGRAASGAAASGMRGLQFHSGRQLEFHPGKGPISPATAIKSTKSAEALAEWCNKIGAPQDGSTYWTCSNSDDTYAYYDANALAGTLTAKCDQYPKVAAHEKACVQGCAGDCNMVTAHKRDSTTLRLPFYHGKI